MSGKAKYLHEINKSCEQHSKQLHKRPKFNEYQLFFVLGVPEVRPVVQASDRSEPKGNIIILERLFISASSIRSGRLIWVIVSRSPAWTTYICMDVRVLAGRFGRAKCSNLGQLCCGTFTSYNERDDYTCSH